MSCDTFLDLHTESLQVLALAGISGSAPIACGGGSVGDLFSEKDRASAMAIYSLGPLIGPVIGPVAGGFIAQAGGIRWVFIAIARRWSSFLACSLFTLSLSLLVICGVASLYGLPFLRETYGPVIRYRRAKQQGELEKFGQMYPHLVAARGSATRVLWENLTRPIQLLFKSLICFLLSFYMAV